VQEVTNALGMTGDVWIFGDSGTPASDALIETAREASVPVIAIRAVAAGALTEQELEAVAALRV
jgi:hypothetical protein